MYMFIGYFMEPFRQQVVLPNYFKYFILLSSAALTVYIVVILQSILKPLLAAFIFALLLRPLCTQLERLKLPRALSTLLSMFVVVVALGGLLTFFSSQVANISSDMNSLVTTFEGLFDRLQQWASDTLQIAPHQQVDYIKDSIISLLKNSTSFFRNTLSATAGFFTAFILFLIALFFFLYYRHFWVEFLFKIFAKTNHPTLKKTLLKIEGVIKNYVFGLSIVILTMATLNTVGLLLLGIKHAIFFGSLAAILTIIPYVGIMIGSLLPIVFALATTDSIWYPVGVLCVFVFVQFLEGNFITPNIIGNSVSINPFVALLGLFVGGMLLGVIGVIFAIPVLAIIKVICDNVESLHSIGFILGNPGAFISNR